jgi:hypothetical protein
MAAALIGLGLLILFRNVAGVSVLVNLLQAIGDQVDSGGLLAVCGTAARHCLQAYLFNHAEFLRLTYQVLLSFLGLLFIVMGAILAAVFAGRREGLRKRRSACRFRCLSFDA